MKTEEIIKFQIEFIVEPDRSLRQINGPREYRAVFTSARGVSITDVALGRSASLTFSETPIAGDTLRLKIDRTIEYIDGVMGTEYWSKHVGSKVYRE